MRGELLYAGAAGWRCSDEGDCWVLDDDTNSDDKGGGLFEGLALPSWPELAKNAWPLVILWPVLFAFYNVELALGLEV